MVVTMVVRRKSKLNKIKMFNDQNILKCGQEQTKLQLQLLFHEDPCSLTLSLPNHVNKEIECQTT